MLQAAAHPRHDEEKAVKELVDKLSVEVYKIAAEMFKFKVESSVVSVPTMLARSPGRTC